MRPFLHADAIMTMQKIADNFYYNAVRQPCHAFIEFAGLMNEYINICAENEHFQTANRHTGQPMTTHPHQIDYLREKLQCIFSPFANVDIAPLPSDETWNERARDAKPLSSLTLLED